MKKTVVFDFDGVIHSYTSGWKGECVIPDPPVPGIKEAINEIRAAGYEVVVVSTRCASVQGHGAVRAWLLDNGIQVDAVKMEKPPAIAYIDDRAICFDGNSEELLNKISSFEPWYAKQLTNADRIRAMSDAEGYATAGDLISRKALLEKAVEVPGHISKMVSSYDIATAPAVTAQPVKRGQWLNWRGEPISPDDYWRVWRCSECGNEIEFDEAVAREEFTSSYCPNCGAKMDGERKSDGP